jgi:hypothetical protein
MIPFKFLFLLKIGCIFNNINYFFLLSIFLLNIIVFILYFIILFDVILYFIILFDVIFYIINLLFFLLFMEWSYLFFEHSLIFHINSFLKFLIFCLFFLKYNFKKIISFSKTIDMFFERSNLVFHCFHWTLSFFYLFFELLFLIFINLDLFLEFFIEFVWVGSSICSSKLCNFVFKEIIFFLKFAIELFCKSFIICQLFVFIFKFVNTIHNHYNFVFHMLMFNRLVLYHFILSNNYV